MLLSNEQQQIRDLIERGENVVILGVAGSGKSFMIDQITDDQTIKCAPTGIAALNIGGVTCHKMFALPTGIPQEEDYFIIGGLMAQLCAGNDVKRIIIDEGMMLSADFLDMIDSKLRTLRRNSLPFGGIQMVLVGDLFQLEPVLSNKESKSFKKKYKTPFCFSSDCFDFKVVELTKVFRQEKEEQVKLLNSIRLDDENAESSLDKIAEIAKEYQPTEATLHLCCYKRDADVINKIWYSQVKGEESTYKAVSDKKWRDAVVPDKIKLKVGCRVLIKANDRDGNYVNGDRGRITMLSPAGAMVRLDSGRQVMVEPYKWEKYDYKSKNGAVEKVVESTYTQLPLLLGYGVSIHNAQGMTLEDVAIDFGQGCFAHGQCYVALSRIKDLENMSFVQPPHRDDIIVDQRVKDFYNSILGDIL